MVGASVNAHLGCEEQRRDGVGGSLLADLVWIRAMLEEPLHRVRLRLRAVPSSRQRDECRRALHGAHQRGGAIDLLLKVDRRLVLNEHIDHLPTR